jgi:SAM-dependent methyltransferase
MLSMLPPVDGLRVLDAGCGSGRYSEQLHGRGARVRAIDGSAAMVAHARARLGDRVEVRVAHLAGPLPFPDSSFDLVLSALVLHYLRDGEPTLRELRRVLAPGGTLLFSTHHPAHEAQRLGGEGYPVRYAEVQPVEEEWKGIGRVRFFRRSFTAICDALADARFPVERLVEPVPTQAFRATKPESYQRLLRRPEFLIVRAITRS